MREKQLGGGVEDGSGAEGVVTDAKACNGAKRKLGVVVEHPIDRGIDDFGNR